MREMREPMYSDMAAVLLCRGGWKGEEVRGGLVVMHAKQFGVSERGKQQRALCQGVTSKRRSRGQMNI